MKNANNWSKWRQDITIKFLRNRNKVARLRQHYAFAIRINGITYCRPRVCHLKNIDGRDGLICATDILANKWVIQIDNSETTVVFENLVDLVKAGWVAHLGINLQICEGEIKTAEQALEAVEQSYGRALAYVPKKLMTEEICLEAFKAAAACGPISRIDKTKASLAYVPKKLRTAKMCLEVVKLSGYELEHVPKKLMTEEICIAAVKDWSGAFKYVPKKFMTLDEIRLAKDKWEKECAMEAAECDSGAGLSDDIFEYFDKHPCNSEEEKAVDNNWSDSLQDRTINTLSDMDCVGFWHSLPNKRGVLKNCNGSYGFMKAEDAIAQKWVITLENGETVSFASITDLVKAGWVVD